MTPRLVFRPQAESEILEARNWYEERRQGLGEAFATAVDVTVAGILEAQRPNPGIELLRSEFVPEGFQAARPEGGCRHEARESEEKNAGAAREPVGIELYALCRQLSTTPEVLPKLDTP